MSSQAAIDLTEDEDRAFASFFPGETDPKASARAARREKPLGDTYVERKRSPGALDTNELIRRAIRDEKELIKTAAREPPFHVEKEDKKKFRGAFNNIWAMGFLLAHRNSEAEHLHLLGCLFSYLQYLASFFRERADAVSKKESDAIHQRILEGHNKQYTSDNDASETYYEKVREYEHLSKRLNMIGEEVDSAAWLEVRQHPYDYLDADKLKRLIADVIDKAKRDKKQAAEFAGFDAMSSYEEGETKLKRCPHCGRLIQWDD